MLRKYSITDSNVRFQVKMENVRFTIAGFSRIVILQNELTSEKACRMCITIICPVSTNGIVVVWYLLNLPKVAKNCQKFWELWQRKILFHAESFAQSKDS